MCNVYLKLIQLKVSNYDDIILHNWKPTGLALSVPLANVMPAATAIRTHGKNPDQPEEGIDGYGRKDSEKNQTTTNEISEVWSLGCALLYSSNISKNVVLR